MGKVANIMSSMALMCRNAHHNVHRVNYEYVLNFLRDREKDSKFCAAILAGLPKEIMQRYFEERRS